MCFHISVRRDPDCLPSQGFLHRRGLRAASQKLSFLFVLASEPWAGGDRVSYKFRKTPVVHGPPNKKETLGVTGFPVYTCLPPSSQILITICLKRKDYALNYANRNTFTNF
jgi:hypothetical protein